jgi:soluble lytic murein transglycosylase-like protein
VPNVDLTSHEPRLESKRRSRARRSEARKARRLTRGRKTAAVVAALSLTVAAGGAVAAGGSGGASSVKAAGASVTALQSALGISADGVYGPQTRAAVKRFQRSHGLAVDGIAGPATLGALGLSGKSVSGAGSSSRSTGSASAVLAAIARCESGGDPTAVSPSGRYRGKYQFSRSTWRGLGGTGDPAAAPEAVQDQIAAKLYAARGKAPWPACGKSA